MIRGYIKDQMDKQSSAGGLLHSCIVLAVAVCIFIETVKGEFTHGSLS